MNTLIDIIKYLIFLADIGAGFRALYCLIRIMANPDEVSSYTKKINHVLIFAVFANCSLALMLLVERYFL
ncbi:hypothetical protein R2R35_18480 [Anaerocolumna sp. AGMB13020]|uniref:hypothetical protein n=1 Tax=Anaerocolumna sp. AGMB13020 TaxID=3081750 RepID=UPI0029558E01|nr:hypothetical protein [Anaerocolumna sp. AGMB13020]WOO35768.1 hypothetical protein R2R35_18480 [Anaerocolumna sp. AGMB13020]